MGWHITVTDVVRFIVLYMVLPLFTNVLEVWNSQKFASGAFSEVRCLLESIEKDASRAYWAQQRGRMRRPATMTCSASWANE